MGRRSKSKNVKSSKMEKKKSSMASVIPDVPAPPPPLPMEPVVKVSSRMSLYQDRKRLGSISNSSNKSPRASAEEAEIIAPETPIFDEQNEIEEIREIPEEEPKENAISCVEIPEPPESESDPEEDCDGARIGEEISQELLESALGICSERFYHRNASSSVTMELRNTWLRIIEAEWMDEYKPEIGHLSGNVFQADVPPAPLPFDTWCRGTLEVLDTEPLRGVPTTTASMFSRETKLTMSTEDFEMPQPPSDEAYPPFTDVTAREFKGEGDFDNRPDAPSLTMLFRGKPRHISWTKLWPEDGFNIPEIGRYSGDTGSGMLELPLPTQKMNPDGDRFGGVFMGEDEFDSFLPMEPGPKTVTGNVMDNRHNRKTHQGIGSGAGDTSSTASAFRPHHIASHTEIEQDDADARLRKAVKEQLANVSNAASPEKKSL